MTDAPDAIDLTRKLVAFDTINPPGDEGACASFLAEILENAGFDCMLQEMGEGRANLIARIGNGTGRPIGFTGHLDTVPLGLRDWRHDPFACVEEEGRLYGRGTCDMKGGVAAFVSACIAEAELLRAGPGAVLLITAGEETGSDGARHLVEAGHLPQMGALVVAEPSSNKALLGHKGALWLKIVSHGVTAHGSMPEKGDNAVVKAAQIVGRLAEFDFNVARHPIMGKPTLNIGTISGGLNTNSVPDRAEIGLDMRTITGMDHARLREQIASLVGDLGEVETLIDLPPVWTAPEDEWACAVQERVAARTGHPAEPQAVTYFTDASIFTPAAQGVPTIILGPGDAALAHQTDEYVEVSRVEEAVLLYRDLLRDWHAR